VTIDIYKVQLENIFEGPMDLLVYLIRKNEVNIYDIPIAVITNHYLEYIEWMKSLNIDIAGDFLIMAATLIQIKSRMLLPAYENSEEEDPRMEIARPLLEYLRIKSAAFQLNERHILGEHVFARSYIKSSASENSEEQEIHVDIFELVQAFQKVLASLSSEISLEVVTDTLSVQDRMTEIIDLLKIRRTITFHELLSYRLGRTEIIVTFLAILEMAKSSIARVVQHIETGIIRLFLDDKSNAETEVSY